MGRKNQQQALLSGPPAELTPSQAIGRVEVINGNNIYTVTLPSAPATANVQASLHMVELPPKFRNTMWIRRGGFVLVDRGAFEGRENKLSGEIVTVIHDEKSWRKMNYWPTEFAKVSAETTKTQTQRNNNDGEDSSEDELLGSGNMNRRRQQDSSDEDE